MKTLPPKILGIQIITQYGSTVYIRMAMGGSALEPYIRIFTFNLSSMDIKVENM